MITLNIHEAKTHLSKYLAQLEKGETILLCKRNVPIAEIRALKKDKLALHPRPIGLAKGQIHIPEEFYLPLSFQQAKRIREKLLHKKHSDSGKLIAEDRER
ncbi:hypothetical protein BH10PSE19_BH10PSE19_16550 [soil metagenome]